jgi:hypothetical protein
LEGSAFDRHIGIDYSGAKTPTARLKGLRVSVAKPGEEPEVEKPASSTSRTPMPGRLDALGIAPNLSLKG